MQGRSLGERAAKWASVSESTHGGSVQKGTLCSDIQIRQSTPYTVHSHFPYPGLDDGDNQQIRA